MERLAEVIEEQLAKGVVGASVAVVVFLRLGLVAPRLEGMAYARSEMGEFAMPVELEPVELEQPT